ncbi:MAG: hypothetical protein ACRDWA_16275 [Acidimicrobiia bacterium]
MVIEDRLREYFEVQYEATPAPENRLHVVARNGRRRLFVRRSLVGVAGVAALLVLVIGSGWFLRVDQAMAASPFSGMELPVVNEAPLILKGELGPGPEVAPSGSDLTFVPIDKPTANDLAAIQEIIQSRGYTDPVVVALGRIESFDTNVYALHQIDQGTGRGQSQVLAVGPDYRSFVSVSGPSENEQWGPSSSQSQDGSGFAFLRIPEYATWQYTQLDVDGEVFWQRASDGFIWMPFQANLDSAVILTAHDPATGEALLRHIVSG